MKLDLIRIQMGEDATNGLLFIDNVFECYTLEDQYQDVKVMHETCIPEGNYEIKYRTVGGFDSKYKARYKEKHFGMLELQNVPNFKYILIHAGNTDESTSGCVLVGDTQQDLDVSKDGFIGSSRNAYEKMYKKVSYALNNDEKVNINIHKIDFSKPISNKSTDDVINIISIHDTLDKISNQVGVLLALTKSQNKIL